MRGEAFYLLEKDIQVGTTEAKENLRWLSILKEPCEALAEATPPEIPALLPGILNFVRLIWSCSTHYGTDNRISGLLKKISNEIIRRCQATIELADIFEGKIDAAMEQLEQSIQCGREWNCGLARSGSDIVPAPSAVSLPPRCPKIRFRARTRELPEASRAPPGANQGRRSTRTPSASSRSRSRTGPSVPPTGASRKGWSEEVSDPRSVPCASSPTFKELLQRAHHVTLYSNIAPCLMALHLRYPI